MIPHRMYIVPLDGADTRFLGGSVRARNARVAQRAGAEIVLALQTIVSRITDPLESVVVSVTQQIH